MNYLEQEIEQEEKLSRGLGVSFALHVLILAFFTVKTVFFAPESIDFSQAIRVDIVGLPDKKEEPKPALPNKDTAPEKKAPEPIKPEPAKPVTKKDDGINLEKIKSKQQNALDKLKALAALEKIKAAVANEKKTDGSLKVKGNVLSPGSSLNGLTKLQHDTYAADLDRHIKESWALPEWLAKRDLTAQARVYIDPQGNILGRKIVKSSGNPSYDEEVLATIDRAAPYPAPPEKFQALVSVDGILIGFPE